MIATIGSAVDDSPFSSESTPVLSRESLSAFVVYFGRRGSFDAGDISVRRIDESGNPLGVPLQITDDRVTDDILADASGSLKTDSDVLVRRF